MNVTLFAGLATAALDPILIFGFDLDCVGAAIAALLSRGVLVYTSAGGEWCGSTTWSHGRLSPPPDFCMALHCSASPVPPR